jgi:hypothetical protein
MKQLKKHPWGAVLWGLAFLSGLSCHAGTVIVRNENHKAIEIKVMGEGSDTTSHAITHKIPEDQEYRFAVVSKDVGNKKYFELQGNTTPFTGGNCRHLDVRKHYEITFQDDAIGSTCLAQEIRIN